MGAPHIARIASRNEIFRREVLTVAVYMIGEQDIALAFRAHRPIDHLPAPVAGVWPRPNAVIQDDSMGSYVPTWWR